MFSVNFISINPHRTSSLGFHPLQVRFHPWKIRSRTAWEPHGPICLWQKIGFWDVLGCFGSPKSALIVNNFWVSHGVLHFPTPCHLAPGGTSSGQLLLYTHRFQALLWPGAQDSSAAAWTKLLDTFAPEKPNIIYYLHRSAHLHRQKLCKSEVWTMAPDSVSSRFISSCCDGQLRILHVCFGKGDGSSTISSTLALARLASHADLCLWPPG